MHSMMGYTKAGTNMQDISTSNNCQKFFLTAKMCLKIWETTKNYYLAIGHGATKID